MNTTLAGLRSLVTPMASEIYQIIDFGGGQWYYDPTDTSSADNTATVVASVSGGRFKRIYDENINALWFGIIGDGITVNTTAIQNAVHFCSVSKVPLFFPGGTYITERIWVPSDVTVKGVGDQTIIKLAPGSVNDTSIFYMNNTSGDISNISFSDLTLDGNRPNNTGDYIHCFYGLVYQSDYKIENIKLENVNFKQAKDYGALLFIGFSNSGEPPINNISVINCKFSDTGGVSVNIQGCNNINFTGCHFTSWGLDFSARSSLNIASLAVYNLFVNKCTFVNTVGTLAGIESSCFTKGFHITDNFFDGNLLSSGISGAFVDGIISGNVHVRGNGGILCGYEMSGRNVIISNNYLQYGAISLYGSAGNENYGEDTGKDFIVTGNKVIVNGTNNVCLAISGSSELHHANNIVIADNLFDSSESVGNAPTLSIGYYGSVGYFSDVTLHHNRIITSSPGETAINVISAGPVKNLNINNNYIKAYCGIRMSNTSDYSGIIITDNDLTGCDVPLIFMDGGINDQFKIVGNVTSAGNYNNFSVSMDDTLSSGTGSPEGVVTANPASLYLRTDNGTSYIKNTGSGNTGWVSLP